jgi:hypothetical protein
MLTRTFQLKLSATQDDYLERRAIESDASVGDILRALIQKEMRREASAKTTNRADETLVARLQRLLVPTMAEATSWFDLEVRLAEKGYVLQPAGGGVTLHDLTTQERLCKCSELGFAYSRLVRKFRQPMPGHPQKMAHVLAAIRDLPEDVADDFDVIERSSPFSKPARPVSRQSARR